MTRLHGIQWTYSIPGPLVTSYDMPGIQWTYSIPGPLVTSYDMPAWDTVDLFYPRALSYLLRHAWDTVDLFYPRTLSYLLRHDCMGHSGPILSPDPWLPPTTRLHGIQWTYSIPGPLVTSYDTGDTVDLFYPRALSYLLRHACMGYSGPILSPGP